MSGTTGAPPGPLRPGLEHERLKPFAGRFRAAVKLFRGPDNVLESTGTMNSEFQLDGLYLHQDYVGDTSDGPFPNFLGKGYWGFNTTTSRYEGFWIDNASTMMQTETGEVDAGGKIWTMHGELTRPATGRPLRKRRVFTVIDHDHHKMECTSPEKTETNSRRCRSTTPAPIDP